jgi:hypothetical protein
MILGGELIRQPDAPVRPVLIQLPATSVTPDVAIQKAVRLWKSAGHVKDTERKS